MSIKFIGSVNTSYKRGKDKTKRKSRGLLTAAGLGVIGTVAGSSLAQSGLIVDKLKKVGSKSGYKFNILDKTMAHGFGQYIVKNMHDNPEKSKVITKQLKVLNKAKLRGGIKGAAIGAGIGLGSTYLINKLRNKDKN